MQLAMQAAIQVREKTELGKGMKAESSFSCSVVPEGGTVAVPVTLQPGGCYTALAQSFPNVTEIDVALKPNFGPTPPPLLMALANQPFAQDNESGPTAAIGKGRDCFKVLLPIPAVALVEVTARAGAGPIAVQLYRK